MAKQPAIRLTRRGQLVVDTLTVVGIIMGIVSMFALVKMFAA